MQIPFAFRCRIGRLLAVLMLCGAFVTGAVVPSVLAQSAAPAAEAAADFKTKLPQWQNALERAANRIAGGDLANTEYETLRADLAKIQHEVRESGAAAAAARDTAQRMLDALGPPPAQGAPPEEAGIAAERKRLTQTIGEAEGRTKQTELIVTRADILLRTAADQRMTQLTEQIVRRGPVPLLPATWAALPEQTAYVQERMARAFGIVMGDDEWRGRLYGLGALAAVLFLVAWPVRRVLLRRYGHRDLEERPSYRQRVVAMAVEALARCLVPLVPTLVLSGALVGLLRDAADAGPLTAVVVGVSGGLTAYFLVTGVARATLAPDHPSWQLANLDPDSARRLVRRVPLVMIGLALAGTGIALSEGMFTPPELRSITGFGTMALIAVSLLFLYPDHLWLAAPPPEAEATDDCGCPEPTPAAGLDVTLPPPAATPAAAEVGEAPPARPRVVGLRLRLLIGAVTLASLVAAGAGYLVGAIYASKLMLTTLIIGGVLLVARGVLRELLCVLLERGSGQVAEVRDIVIATDRGRRMLGQAGRTVIDGLLLTVAAFFLLPLTGMTLSEMKGLADGFLSGVTVGGVRIAPGDIMSALMVLGVVVAVTRFIQRQLDERILGRVNMDDGVRNSIRMGVGYLGTTMAVLMSVGTLGLDLSSLAMIASALSVGIGFGLQNVVSNFISGLIMLVERPVKVGDWVVVNGLEGTVRRISVRATEIQTFQRASVIIPNSEFISKSVVNWTLKDKTTRIEIKVRITYDTDARQVYALLLRIGYGHAQVLRNPEPVVMFRDFLPSGPEFELRCFVANTDHIIPVRNELRLRILEQFREQGIEMPFDQQTVHMPKVEAMLELLLAERRAQAGGVPELQVVADGGKVVPLADTLTERGPRTAT
ncbi:MULTISPECIES: DUF3772 domain-containing protein [Azospirillum]|uniref:DUF3772 domain-containing protein n=4 Tax=Azospirillum brasilense TaxID=192 RepID=A0ABU4P1B9_AZOBR|nr:MULTISPECIES: DUF3772 domain-containing protein [Azospirillum]ALJ37074.1 hypothetical protein AMK58_16355 [Azospirillum brasilense]MDW7551768.1 DUF3772 domain-containing protein [Azospirillum brasilense]MDW7591203.1 DUF3772 domain-containing protein [Azospirillum brasilense]MDW7626373.1 DUF3772 domain-containing protein [Azospirillum brasilense]MDX5951278.1 DUF3772 domain-containing protein [Azospirillum brasilense]